MTPPRSYVREIETRWAALLDRPVVLGERDWSVICDWHARGIPLALIGEAFDHLAETLRRRRSPPRNLGALAPFVEEGWRTVCGGQHEVSEQEASVQADPRVGAVEAWRRCAETLGSDSPLGAWIGALLERVAGGEGLEQVEKDLVAGLVERLGDEARADLEGQVKGELDGFRGRMTRQTWETTRRRALLSAARRRYGLPRLGGPPPSP
jgi:hypothetical protein